MPRRPPSRRPGAGRGQARPRAAQPSGGSEHVESWPDGEWVVRRVSGAAAAKPYVCPGCVQPIPTGTAHIVAWPVEGSRLTGGGVGERRHWHTSCWRARGRRLPP